VTETTEKAAPNKTLYIVLGLVLAVAVAAGVYYWRGGFAQSGARVADKDKVDPEVAVLMEPGPLPDIVIGSASAPNTIVEYASMTCPHCAHFAETTFPEFKKRYVDTGKARYIFREFPLYQLAAAAFMLARCASETDSSKYFTMIDTLFRQQKAWAIEKPLPPLMTLAKQAGFTEATFNACLQNQKLLDGIEAVRTRAVDKFKVQSTPSFFINGTLTAGAMTIDEMAKQIDPLVKG
jgi:protein-disulfide isomerase